ncbi:MAG: glycosyltransferase, partial [Flavobacteriales bacterium]
MSRILIAVLNWGMGHASRTLPIIEGALDLGWEVDVASTGDALIWLKNRLKNRSGVTFFDKPGAAITYSHKFTMLKLVAQTPKLLLSISEEKKWTAKHVKERSITKIFSDNCLGTYDANVPSVLMTHLLKFPVPK